jgi:NADH:ubiquinone oxidoreductase subunit H
MVQWQVDHVWGIFVQPLAFLLFFTAAVAETKRVPFDAPEGESEIVAGYFTEYQPMKMGMFALGELVEVMTSSALITTIFGLTVAIPVGVAFYTLRNRVIRVSTEINAISENLFERFRAKK